MADDSRSQVVHLLAKDVVIATYRVGMSAPRPFVDLMTGPDGQRITRAAVLGALPEESRDHPHHRGLWWGHRNVDGGDFWTEFPGHGRIEHRGFDEQRISEDGSRVVHRLHWVHPSGSIRILERRVLQVWPPGPDGERMLDVETTLEAAAGTVVMHDTKEAAMIAVRVAVSMEERRGGRIENADGWIGEAACWGRAAAWCDYSGVVDGTTLGVAILDHPTNPRYPTTWHVRDYGLMAVNPFGYSDFDPGKGRDGSLRIDPGKPVRFRYRVLVHRGTAAQGRVMQHHETFAAILDETAEGR